MPISPRRTDRRAHAAQAGFTLVEMLVVVAIVGLLAALAAVRLPGAASVGQRQRDIAVARDVLGEAREAAMAGGQDEVVSAASLAGKDGLVTLDTDDKSPTLRFFADGSSTGGTILLAGKPLLQVDELSGAIDDAR